MDSCLSYVRHRPNSKVECRLALGAGNAAFLRFADLLFLWALSVMTLAGFIMVYTIW